MPLGRSRYPYLKAGAKTSRPHGSIMQVSINQMALVIIVVALLMLFGSDGMLGFGRDLQKAWRDFFGIFKR